MIEYSTNQMGPYHMGWYEKNKVPMITETHIRGDKMFPEKAGEPYTYERPSVSYAMGRIDIYGLEGEEYYCGRHEYGVDVMTQKSWYLLTEYLEDFRSPELVPYKELLEGFETETGYTIEWFKYEDN